MKLNTKHILSIVALLSVGVADGKKITKCIVKPKLTMASIPSSIVTDDASNNEPVTMVENMTTTVEIPTEPKSIVESSIKKKEPTPTNGAAPISVEIPVTKPTPVVESAPDDESIPDVVEPPPVNQKSEAFTKTRRIPVTIEPIVTTTKEASSSKETIEPIATSTKEVSSSSKETTESTPSTSKSSTNSNAKLPDVVGGETGNTTRYWDCCLASCAWKENTGGSVVNACEKDGKTIIKNFSYLVGNVCADGNGYMCNNNQPWEVSDDVAYGFAAASFKNGSQSDWCCSCYRLQFTSGPVKGKQMIVQVTNTGSDLSHNHFDIQIPGGGVGIFNGCQKQWNTPENGWGERYGGIKSSSDCSTLPKELQDGCHWRFDWFKNADNPDVTFERVQCPTELTSKSGCVPSNNSNFKKIPWN